MRSTLTSNENATGVTGVGIVDTNLEAVVIAVAGASERPVTGLFSREGPPIGTGAMIGPVNRIAGLLSLQYSSGMLNHRFQFAKLTSLDQHIRCTDPGRLRAPVADS